MFAQVYRDILQSLQLRSVSLTLHKSQYDSSVRSRSFSQRCCSNNPSPCQNMLIHLLHPYSHGQRLHTHMDTRSSIIEHLSTNSPFLHIRVRGASDNAAWSWQDVGGFVLLAKETKGEVCWETITSFSECAAQNPLHNFRKDASDATWCRAHCLYVFAGPC